MNKTALIGIAAIVLIGLALFGLGGSDTQPKENKVGVTIFPIYDITREIAGDEMEVVLLLPPGTSPHTFDPSPSLLTEVGGAKAVFAIGLGLDNWSDNIADSIDAPVVTLEEDIVLRETEEGHHGHDEEKHDDEHDEHEHEEHEDEHGHDEHDDEHDEEKHDEHEDEHGHNHGPIDPHYWLSVKNAQIIAMNIAKELGKLDSANAALYTERAESYVQELKTLDTELQQKVTVLSGNNIVSLHDAWYYFAEEFGVNLVGTFEPAAATEPTPQYLATLQEEVEENNVTTVFMEPQLSSASIQAFASDNNLGIAILDPIGGVDERDSYVNLMRYNVDQLVGALTN